MSILNNFSSTFFNNRDGAVIVMSEVNRFYLTGFNSSDGVVLITNNAAFLIVDFRYYEMAKNEVKDFEVILADKSLIKCAFDLCLNQNIETVYFEDDFVTMKMYEALKEVFAKMEILPIGDFISKMRAIKTQDEITKIKNAQHLTDMAFEHILNYIRPGITESDVALELEYFMRKNGAQSTAFKTIVVSGVKSSLPHGEPSGIVLTNNSFLTMDYGAKLDGYCADMTRTVVLGDADSDMKYIYNVVLEAQENALKEIRAGVFGSDVDKAARDIIEASGYGKNFGHSTGHGLGIEVHESPSFSTNYKKTIPENSVLSVEPGIYIEGKYGVRIEDIVVVTNEKALNLTQSSKKLIEI